MPTLSPTQEVFDSIAIDEAGRRYYPRTIMIEQYECDKMYMWTNLYPTARKLVRGLDALQIPKSFVDNENVLWWAGTLYQKPPYAPIRNAIKEYQCRKRPMQ